VAISAPGVPRRVFNAVIGKIPLLAAGFHLAPPIGIDHFISGGRKSGHGRMANEEFIADVHLVAKRTLTLEDFKLFRYHYCLGADVKLCAAPLGIEREACVQRRQAIEARLGQVFRDMRPYAPGGQLPPHFSTAYPTLSIAHSGPGGATVSHDDQLPGWSRTEASRNVAHEAV
jgi:hypothetical protein